jgi:hypothetical protein
MSHDAWPSPDAPRGPLPRIDELPIAEQGYDQEAVRLAFDSFYRHAAQLDASLRALESVEVFRRDADALRNDLRALREIGLGGPPEPAWSSLRYDAPRREMPIVVLRLAFEAALIVAVAVVAGVAHFRAEVVVALMAGAFLVVAVSEWLGTRGRFVSPATGAAPPPAAAEPAGYLEPAASVWAAPEPEPEPAQAVEAEEAEEPEEPEALTVVGVADEPAPETEPEAAADETGEGPAAIEEEPAAAEAEATDEHDPGETTEDGPPLDPWEQDLAADPESDDPELVERAGFFRRRRR